VDKLYNAYLAEDNEGKEQIARYLEILTARYFRGNALKENIEIVPPSKELADGEYKIGKVHYAGKDLYDFGLREDEWIKHVGIFGISGTGKSLTGFTILKELAKKKKPFLVFDWKRNYRDLLSLPEFKDVQVYTIGRDIAPLQFNPLCPPPGTPPKTWLKKLIEVVAHAYLLGNGVLYILQQCIDAVYEEFDVYSESNSSYPTFRDVYEKARSIQTKGREAGWLSSALRALSSLCFGNMDLLLNQTHKNIDFHKLLEKPVILELDALPQSDKVFFCQALLLYIHHLRMVEPEREKFKHAIVIEEAHHILSNERRSLVGGQSVMEITFREIREFGEGLVIIDQHPSQISLPALGNTNTTIALNLKHSKYINAIGQCLLLESDETDLLGSLEVGSAIVKIQGRIPKPFMIKIPEFEIKKGIIDDDVIRKKMQSIIRMISPDAAREGKTLNNMSTSVKLMKVSNVSYIERAFLEDVFSNPESGVALRYKRLGISVRQGQKAKAMLIEKGLIQEHEEHTNTGRINRIRLTEKGEAIIQDKQDKLSDGSE